MKYEDGFVIMTREEIADGNLKQRVIRCLECLGPLTAVEMNRICCGATLGERDGILIMDNTTRKWRIA